VSRASAADQTERINMAIELLKKKASPGEAVSSLARRYGLSHRQAYRYLQQAHAADMPLPIPESKAVFTVKLPPSLIKAVRREARRQRQQISDLVAHALEDFLKQKPGSHG
jgi:transposase-like protein